MAFKFVNWWIRGFIFWCHEQVKKQFFTASPSNIQSADFFYVLTAQIAMGLPVKSEQLWDLLTIANHSADITNLQAGIANHSADITNLQEEMETNNAGIAENLASIGSINKDITDLKSCQTSKWLA